MKSIRDKTRLLGLGGEERPEDGLLARVYDVIFLADTPAGKAFDVFLLLAIVASVLAVMLESVASIRAGYGRWLYAAEWFFTILFTIEYAARLACVRKPSHYSLSFFGVIDLLAVLPTYVSLIVAGTQSLLVIRILRLLRVFRVFKLSRYLGEGQMLLFALRNSRYKITVFLGTVLSIVVIMGAAMYLIEGPKNGFTSIPRGMYWAIVTMTTVGYGDIAPRTLLGQTIAAGVMILGYAIIAVPTGIVSAELYQASRQADRRACPSCARGDHRPDSRFCRHCGASLD